MATRANPISPTSAALSDLAAFLVKVPRKKLEALTEALLAAQDLLDGDPDVESNGAEDDFAKHDVRLLDGGSGCPISDPGGCEHDGRELENEL